MKDKNEKKGWQRTNVSNLLRNGQSGTYYARVKVNGKEKWKSLKTSLFSVAKLKLADFERDVRAQGRVAAAENATTGTDETAVARFIAIHLNRTKDDASLALGTKSRREIAVKALKKTWPELAGRDTRKVTPTDCREWAARALREGTGFISPNANTTRKGMSASAFNKCIEALNAIFEIAREHGVIYVNPAADVSRAPVVPKRMELPSEAQFHTIVKSVSEAGSRQSKDCADMVRLLAYSGARLTEATALRWNHVDAANNRIRIPGTKSENSFRVVPLFPALGALLKEIRTRRGDESANASILAVNECKGALRSACAAVGVKKMTHHDLRHLFATRCIESGVDVPTVSRWLGHSDGGALAMRVYGHLSDNHSQEQATKVNFGGAA